MNEPIFRSCIVSRPLHPDSLYRRLPSFAVATTVYLVGGAGIMLAPLFMPGMDAPPMATVATPTEKTIFFQPPGSGRKNDDGKTPRIRKGARRPEPPTTDQRRETIPHPETNHQPSVPLQLPASDLPPDDPGFRGTRDGDHGVPDSGHPDGDGSSPEGSLHGCPGCPSDGPGGPDDPFSGPIDESNELITTPAKLKPGTRAMPSYPDLARRVGVQGSVILLVIIGVDGRVGAIEVLRSPDPRFGFDLTAIEAVKQWRYSPALVKGRPVAVRMRVFVEFTLAR